MKNKILIWIIVLLAVVVLAVWLTKKNQTKPGGTLGSNGQPITSSTPQVVPLKVTTTDVPKNQAPAGFPSDIPIEKGATITQNYNATSEAGQFQATRVFITAKSLDDNFTLYTNYLKTSGWTIANTINQPAAKVLFANKGPANLQIAITENTVTKQNTVNISYTTTQK